MTLGKCVKQIGAHFTVFSKLNHVSSSGTVKVFYLYYVVTYVYSHVSLVNMASKVVSRPQIQIYILAASLTTLPFVNKVINGLNEKQ